VIASSMTFQQLKSSLNRIAARGEGRHMRVPTLNEIESQTAQADGNRLEKPCKMIGQKVGQGKMQVVEASAFELRG
jgi:hypothetical protein